MYRRGILKGCIFLIVAVCVHCIFASLRLVENTRDLLINERYLSIPKFGFPGIKSVPAATVLHLRESHATFLCVGKNIENTMENILRQIDELGVLFGAFDVLFVDGNSTDESKRIFENFAFQRRNAVKTKFVSVPSENLYELEGPFQGHKMPREGRIAIARNEGLKMLNSDGLGHTGFNHSYVIMIDADVLGWDLHGVIDTFGKRDSWDVVCANGVMFNGIYRDTYAFRSSSLDTNHHWTGSDLSSYNVSRDLLNPDSLSRARKDLRYMQIQARKIMETPIQGNLQQKYFLDTTVLPSNLVVVDSCFAGLAIYKRKIIHNCEYDYRHKDPPNMLDCEHVLFHECMRVKNKAIITTNPKMKLWYGHSIFDQGIWKIYKEAIKFVWCFGWNNC